LVKELFLRILSRLLEGVGHFAWLLLSHRVELLGGVGVRKILSSVQHSEGTHLLHLLGILSVHELRLTKFKRWFSDKSICYSTISRAFMLVDWRGIVLTSVLRLSLALVISLRA
jgi:hypothetical protein